MVSAEDSAVRSLSLQRPMDRLGVGFVYCYSGSVLALSIQNPVRPPFIHQVLRCAGVGWMSDRITVPETFGHFDL